MKLCMGSQNLNSEIWGKKILKKMKQWLVQECLIRNCLKLYSWNASILLLTTEDQKASASTLSNIKISWQNGGYFGSVNHAKNASILLPLYSNPELRKMMQNPEFHCLLTSPVKTRALTTMSNEELICSRKWPWEVRYGDSRNKENS